MVRGAHPLVKQQVHVATARDRAGQAVGHINDQRRHRGQLFRKLGRLPIPTVTVIVTSIKKEGIAVYAATGQTTQVDGFGERAAASVVLHDGAGSTAHPKSIGIKHPKRHRRVRSQMHQAGSLGAACGVGSRQRAAGIEQGIRCDQRL